MLQPKYVVCPGWVISRTDGDRHWIGVRQLVRLYGLLPGQYRIYDELQPLRENEVALQPRFDGNYQKVSTDAS